VTQKSAIGSIGRYIVIGTMTAAPLVITWLIIDFIFRQLSRIGEPWVRSITRAIGSENPTLIAWFENETFLSLIAVILTLAALWALGRMTTHVIGRRLISFFETVIGNIPVIDKIYKAARRFLTVASPATPGEQRIVLIDFPSPSMKAVGIVTAMMKDKETGRDLAAVYVPTSPNPTSGYIEIVPVENLIFTDWTFDQAMSFVVTGGSNAPSDVSYFSRTGAKAQMPASD
jgi:uncharacterized membrane protein